MSGRVAARRNRQPRLSPATPLASSSRPAPAAYLRFDGQDNDVDATRVSQNSSYIGFKGSEDLGNGLKALFQYETTVNFDSGTGFGGSRDSFVGLSHANAGTVVLGNLTGPTRALGAALDVNPGATGIGANSGLIGKIAGSTLKSSVVANGVIAATGAAVNANTTLGYGSANGCGRSQHLHVDLRHPLGQLDRLPVPELGRLLVRRRLRRQREQDSRIYGTIHYHHVNAAGVATVMADARQQPRPSRHLRL